MINVITIALLAPQFLILTDASLVPHRDTDSSGEEESFDCPRTPSWEGVRDEYGVPFEERYRDVEFSAPNHFDFNEFDVSMFRNMGEVEIANGRDADVMLNTLPYCANHHGIQRHDKSHDQHDARDSMAACESSVAGKRRGQNRQREKTSCNTIDRDAIIVHHSDPNQPGQKGQKGRTYTPGGSSSRLIKEHHDEPIANRRQNSISGDAEKRGWIQVQERQDETRAILEEAWAAHGITYDIGPQALALAIAKIKIELDDGNDMSLSLTASSKIQRETSDEYYTDYQLMCRKFTSKIIRLRLKAEANDELKTPEQKKQYVLDNVGKLN